jgi:hypothetical protein
MREGARPLLCELHAHTTWSDGELSLAAVVDLYGTAAFDVLCVTDHVLRRADPWPLQHGRPCVDATNVGAYLAEIERERARALSAYGLLLVPGFELTYNDPNPDRAAHAVAVGLRSLVAMDDGPAAAMEKARAAGAAVLAAHPHHFGPTPRRPVPHLLLRAALAGAARARQSRRALQRAAAVRLGRGGRTAGRRLRRPAPGRPAARLDDARSLRARRGGARRLPTLVPARVPDAPRTADRRARRVAGAGRYAVVRRCSHGGSAHDPRASRCRVAFDRARAPRPIRSRTSV